MKGIPSKSLLVKVAFRGGTSSSVCCFTTLDFLDEKVKLSLILFMIVTALTAFDVRNLQPFLPEVGNDQFFFSARTERRTIQWLFLVPLKGGRWHIIPQLAVYTTYIPLIYCLLGGYMLPTTF